MSKTEFDLNPFFDALDKELVQKINYEYPELFKQKLYLLAEELCGRVIENTPRQFGDLQAAWTVGDVVKKGDTYYIEVYNNLDYAESVEDGHQQEVGRYVPAIGKRLKKPLVEGAHMMEISLAELEARLPQHLKDWLSDFLKFNM